MNKNEHEVIEQKNETYKSDFKVVLGVAFAVREKNKKTGLASGKFVPFILDNSYTEEEKDKIIKALEPLVDISASAFDRKNNEYLEESKNEM